MAFVGEDVFVRPKEKHVRSVANIVRSKIDSVNPPMLTDQQVRVVHIANPNTGDTFLLKDHPEDPVNYWVEIWHPEYCSLDEESGLCPVDIYELYSYQAAALARHSLHLLDANGEIFVRPLPAEFSYYDIDEKYAEYLEFRQRRTNELASSLSHESGLGLDEVDRNRLRRLGIMVQQSVVISGE